MVEEGAFPRLLARGTSFTLHGPLINTAFSSTSPDSGRKGYGLLFLPPTGWYSVEVSINSLFSRAAISSSAR